MSDRVKPSFTVDGQRYEFVFSRTLQVKYQDMFNEKKNDPKYQQEVAESERLKKRYETIHAKFNEIEQEYFLAISNGDFDENKEKAYNKLEELEKKAQKEYAEYIATHSSEKDALEFTTYVIGQLILLALQTQYNLSEEQSKEIWNKYVADNGDMCAMKFLIYVAGIWLADDEAGEDDPFFKAMEAKAERAENRKKGLKKLNR